MQEMLGVTASIVGQGLGDSVALITDGRFSGVESWQGSVGSGAQPKNSEHARRNQLDTYARIPAVTP
jgi:hypothetical protein